MVALDASRDTATAASVPSLTTSFFFVWPLGLEKVALVRRNREHSFQEIVGQNPMRIELAADCRKFSCGKPIRETGCDFLRVLRIGWKFDLCPVFNRTVARPQKLLAPTFVRIKRTRNFVSSLRLIRWEVPAGSARYGSDFWFSRDCENARGPT